MKGKLIVQIKENQKKLLQEVKKACSESMPSSVYVAPIEKSRNRIEQREAAVFDVKPYLIKSHDWNKYISCIIQVKRYTEVLNTKTKMWKIRKETAYYAASHLNDAQTGASYIREHWGIENRNHYIRDVVLKEDASRIRTNPGIFARMRSFALNILRFNKTTNIQEALYENTLDFDNVLIYKGIS